METYILKRSASSSPVERPAKKQRGRPRVESRDETPADRRRTQIRLAQRIYRARKEERIEYLESVIRTSESAIRELLTRDYNNLINASPVSVHGLNLVADGLAAAIDKEAIEPTGEPSSDLPCDDKSARPQQPTPPSSEDSSSDVHSRGMQLQLQSQPQPLSQPQLQAYQGQQQWTIHSPSHDLQMSHSTFNDYTTAYAMIPNSSGANMSSPLPHELPLPQTYSYNELSFSRAFHRHCLEYAASLLNRSDTNPAELTRVFSHALQFSSLEDISQRLNFRLLSSGHDDLGSSYKYTSTHGADPEELQRGPWLDPDDVDLYLHSRLGVSINPRDRVVSCDSVDQRTNGKRPEHSRQDPNSSSTQLSPHNSNRVSAMHNDTNNHANDRQQWSRTSQNGSNAGISVQPRRRFKLDVPVLLTQLAEASRCRGPTPGILRRDVDKAVKSSIISVESLLS